VCYFLSPDRKPVHVKSLVEKPKMYVFGQSKSTDIDQMSYTPTRIQDLQTLDLPTVGSRGIKIYDAMRILQEIEHEQVFCQGIWLYIPDL
jgi:hypothetical protein